MSILDLDMWRAQLADAGLGRYADELSALVEPSIRLRAEPADESALAIGATRLGGRPDLPHGVSWPTFRDAPQSFIAQLDLDELSGLAGAERLPKNGLLSFFYDAGQRVWGFDPEDRGGWHVLYTPAGDALHRTDFPGSLDKDARYDTRVLIPTVEQTFAPWESSDIESLGLTPAEVSAYGNLVPDPDDTATHRLLGHPDPIQNDMQLECQLVTSGLYCGDETGYDDPRAAALKPRATSWRLLLQIDSEEEAGMMWGDVGRLYYWLRRDHLAERRFDETWCILQCS